MKAEEIYVVRTLAYHNGEATNFFINFKSTDLDEAIQHAIFVLEEINEMMATEDFDESYKFTVCVFRTDKYNNARLEWLQNSLNW